MIKPIQTEYKGYKFRSRLEARWAMVFDELGYDWRYEMQGYDLGGIWYLPDFYIKDVEYGDLYQGPIAEIQRTWKSSMFVEIKPKAPTEDEITKAKRLFYGTKKPCLLLWGEPYPSEARGTLFDSEFPVGGQMDGHWQFVDGEDGVILTAGALIYWETLREVYTTGNLGRFHPYSSYSPFCDEKQYENQCFAANNPSVMGAYLKARASRFDGRDV